ncbi:small integral membrane protein 27 [Microcaecilia unicolor]|uniref:Small integral membrane protein 27 n=1 Tax=Microcaecilia unicolor TaxID=1415580 RepID=A0A6P7XAT0_9AMPH|nr:small integral membrane protein 27 [Microcaecilia unicolor]
MLDVSKRALEWLYSLILLAIVVLSWGYVIYATRLAALWQLQKKFPSRLLES